MIRSWSIRRNPACSHLLASTILLLVLGGCAGWQEKNVVRNGIHFDKLRTEELRQEPAATIIVGELAADSEIYGYPCARGFIVFHDNWQLREFKLTRVYPFREFRIPAGTWMFPDRHGNIKTCNFPRDVEIQGHLCRGGRGGLEGVQTSFYENGSLESYFSRKDVVINGIPCLGSVFHPITLHENGQLKRCTLAVTTVIEGVEYLRKTRITFDSHGGFRGVGK